VGRLYGRIFAIQRASIDEVIDWLRFNNHRRLQSALGDISPMEFDQNCRVGQVMKAAYMGGCALCWTKGQVGRLFAPWTTVDTDRRFGVETVIGTPSGPFAHAEMCTGHDKHR
jgi:hypothetical protein